MSNIIKLGNKVIVSDPCYDLGTWCQAVIENVKEGNYSTFFKTLDDDEKTIETIGVVLDGINVLEEDYILLNNTIGVDSGTAGIFDYKYYEEKHDTSENKDKFMDYIEDRTNYYNQNPRYIPFCESNIYKAAMLSIFNKMDELKKKYPDLDFDSQYRKLVDCYSEKGNEYSFSIDKLNSIIENLKNLLEDEDGNKKVKVSEGDKILAEFYFEADKELSDIYKNYSSTNAGSRYIYYPEVKDTENKGIVSQSGYGDGSYECLVAINENNEVIAIKINFFIDYEDEE